MSEKRFVVETVEITDCDTDVSRIAKVITDTKETYSYEDLDEIVAHLNEQQATINKVYELLEEADIFSDEATEHDIKAYIELQEFDNKDAYYLACAIKKAIKLLKGDD